MVSKGLPRPAIGRAFVVITFADESIVQEAVPVLEGSQSVDRRSKLTGTQPSGTQIPLFDNFLFDF